VRGFDGGVPCGFWGYDNVQFHECHRDFSKERGTNFSQGEQPDSLLRKLHGRLLKLILMVARQYSRQNEFYGASFVVNIPL
jgi:hypothetical protein